MPRKAKGARLYFRNYKGNRQGVYVIRDGNTEISTGTACSEQAEAALSVYLIRKADGTKTTDPSCMTIPQALTIYAEGHAADTEDPARIGYAIDALDAWWGDLPVVEITEAKCKAYAKARAVGAGTIRRELGCLRAALNYALPAGHQKPKIWMPAKPAPRDIWMTRDEAAKLIRAARKRPEWRHLARFILIGLYTGSRKSVILGLKFHKHSAGGWVDLQTGLLYRKPDDAKNTNKKAPPAPLPPKLLSHLRRWAKTNQSGWIIEFRGRGVASIKSAWSGAKTVAGLPEITRHTLRHTAITWAMQAGIDRFQACGFFGVSAETLEKVYAHHHPDFLRGAAEAVGRGGRR